jgi:hypothetical protein
MGRMKEIWANPTDYPKKLVWKLNGGKVRWQQVIKMKNVRDVGFISKQKTREAITLFDKLQTNTAD